MITRRSSRTIREEREHGRRRTGVMPPRKGRRVTSALLAGVLAASCMPATAWAIDGDAARATATNTEQAALLDSFANEALTYDSAARTGADTITIDGAAYVPCYAALTYAEYWAAEGVQAAGDATSVDALDPCTEREERDLGAFDAVSRATTNHGLHRGNFQGSIVLHCDNGQDYALDHWDGQTTMVFTDGTRAEFSKGTLTLDGGTTTKMTSYDNTGLRSVPVAVPAADWEAFKARYAVVENGGELAGGYSEVRLKSYTATAAVTADTNGLKVAVKNADGTFSFGTRRTGADTGLESRTLSGGEPETMDTLKVADKQAIPLKVQADTTYGDFIRVDLLGDYGDLGGAMYAAKWTYYGSDASRTKALATYGTKFAADNWMHKSNGIQLGLTLSKRCELPAGTDGAGYWRVTLWAMGYEDVSFDFAVSADEIRVPATEADLASLKARASQARSTYGNDAAYTAASRKSLTDVTDAIGGFSLAVRPPTYKRELASYAAEIDRAVKGLVKAPATPTTPGATAKPGTSSSAGAATPGAAAKPVAAKVAKPAKQKITKLKKAKRAFTVQWKKNKKATFYQVQYATNKSFRKAVTKKVSKKKTALKVSKLKSGKKYYVRVRTVVKAQGKTVYGAWSAKKTVQVR